MELKNYMEELVWTRLDEVMAGHQGMCTCDHCRYDVAALALNFLPTRYVVTEKGEMYTKLRTLEQQFGIDIITAISRAVLIVKNHPRHDEPHKQCGPYEW